MRARGAFPVFGAVGGWVAAAPGTVPRQCGTTFACLELFYGLYVLSVSRLRGVRYTF